MRFDTIPAMLMGPCQGSRRRRPRSPRAGESRENGSVHPYDRYTELKCSSAVTESITSPMDRAEGRDDRHIEGVRRHPKLGPDGRLGTTSLVNAIPSVPG